MRQVFDHDVGGTGSDVAEKFAAQLHQHMGRAEGAVHQEFLGNLQEAYNNCRSTTLRSASGRIGPPLDPPGRGDYALIR